MILFKTNNKGADQTARMRRLVCAFVVCKPPQDRVSRDKAQIYNYYMPVCCIVKSITLRYYGRSDALLRDGFDLVAYFYRPNGIKACAGNDTSVNYNFFMAL